MTETTAREIFGNLAQTLSKEAKWVQKGTRMTIKLGTNPELFTKMSAEGTPYPAYKVETEEFGFVELNKIQMTLLSRAIATLPKNATVYAFTA